MAMNKEVATLQNVVATLQEVVAVLDQDLRTTDLQTKPSKRSFWTLQRLSLMALELLKFQRLTLRQGTG